MLLVFSERHVVLDAVEIDPEGAVGLVLPVPSTPASSLVGNSTILMYDNVTILMSSVVLPIPIASDVSNLNLLI